VGPPLDRPRSSGTHKASPFLGALFHEAAPAYLLAIVEGLGLSQLVGVVGEPQVTGDMEEENFTVRTFQPFSRRFKALSKSGNNRGELFPSRHHCIPSPKAPTSLALQLGLLTHMPPEWMSMLSPKAPYSAPWPFLAWAAHSHAP